MDMDMLYDPRTSRSAEVHPDVDSLRLVRRLEGIMGTTNKTKHLLYERSTEPGQVADVCTRHHHQVA